MAILVLVIVVIPGITRIVGNITTSFSSPHSSLVTWAEPIGLHPDEIFPFTRAPFETVTNVEQFQHLMYRPLYWYTTVHDAQNGDVDLSHSLAALPTYSVGAIGSVVTVTLKPVRWSNGETLSTGDVMFWMNMLHAEKGNWAGYDPTAGGMPDDIANVSVSGLHRITFTLTSVVNPTWFTNSELSQITPFPIAWDRNRLGGPPGSGGCSAGIYGTVDHQCAAVYTFLATEAGTPPTRPSGADPLPATSANPLWQVVDGPWQLRVAEASGSVSLVRNPKYSGPDSGSIQRFEEVPFSSASKEMAALAAGRVNVGYLPLADAPDTATAQSSGPNADGLGHDSVAPNYPLGFDEIALNFHSTEDHGRTGALFSQGYLRSAMQSLIDEHTVIAEADHGYGLSTIGPVRHVSGTNRSRVIPAVQGTSTSPARAKDLLVSHGWRVIPGGRSVCAHAGTGPGDCGAGVPVGTTLSFSLDAATSTTVQATVNVERAAWSTVGIDVTVHLEFAQNVLKAISCATACAWAMADWGGGWFFAPAHSLDLGAVFAPGAAGNAGGFADPSVHSTHGPAPAGSPATRAMTQNVEAKLPVLFEPTTPLSLTEVEHGLLGVEPQSSLGEITPEAWHWSP